MSKKKSIFCFTHYDLDGVVTYLVTKWAHPGYDIEVKALTTNDMRQDIRQWMLTHNFSDYEKVFFLDIDVAELVDLIDFENVVIIDHHKSHVDAMKYKNAVPIVKEYSSAALLAFKAFKKIYNTTFTTEQKMLVIFANDYDSYTLEFKESQMLNVIFWNTQKSFEAFLDNYANGFKAFSKEQLAIYRIYENELTRIIENLQVFQGIYADIEGECRVVVATFADKHTNDIATHLLKTHNCDVAIIISLKSQRVSFRRPKDGTMCLNVFAKDVAEGGGHEYAAGGNITPDFMEFTKTLKPI